MEVEVLVPDSEENGNVPLDAPEETPSEETEVKPATEVVEPTVETYELPDGRKVTGEEVAQEYKNLLSDYTRKSQTLAEIEKGKINQPTEKPYQNPEWQPQSWQEAINIAKQEALQEIEGKEKARVEARQAIENTTIAQITELKTSDTSLNENALFSHAVKYGFKDLKLAYQNMKDMSETIKKVQSTTAANIAKRNDPVSVSPGATGTRPDPSQFGSAIDYLRSLK